jgi:hypothetical protein
MAVEEIGLTPIFPLILEVGTFEIPDSASIVILSVHIVERFTGAGPDELPPTMTTFEADEDPLTLKTVCTITYVPLTVYM